MSVLDFLSKFLLIWIVCEVTLTPRCFAIPCGRSVCSNHGACDFIMSPLPPVKKCTCDAGWSGRICDTPDTVTHSVTSTARPSTTSSDYSNTCKGFPLECSNGGICYVFNNRGRYNAACECPVGWTGNTCATECNLKCYNNGKCEERRSTGKIWNECDCLTGYTGDNCEYPCISVCAVYTCRLRADGPPRCDSQTTPLPPTTTRTTATTLRTSTATSLDISTKYETRTTNDPVTYTDISTTKNVVITRKESTALPQNIPSSDVSSIIVTATEIPATTHTGTTETKSTTILKSGAVSTLFTRCCLFQLLAITVLFWQFFVCESRLL